MSDQPKTLGGQLWRWLRRRKSQPEPTVFVQGDATGSVFQDIISDADVFIRGDSTGAVIENVQHEPKQRRP